MSNPTTPFSWQMPTATDLVTDLPADFEVFGQAVATSMADLLGGTSGQVLAKNSNTDMDFVWVTSDDANAIQNSIVDAKGDLIAASAADTPARLAVGSNGESLVADSSAATGLSYQGNYAAGKNKFINGNMAIAQRGAAAQTVVAASRIFGVDRFFGQLTGAGVFTVEQVVDSPAAANAGQYSMKAIVTTADTSIAAGDQYFIGQTIEGLNFASFQFGTASAQTVTISFWVKSSITGTFGIDIRNGAANRSYVSTYTISAANTWEKKTVTIAGDTSGTWPQDNTLSARIEWSLSAGTDFQTATPNTWTASNDQTTASQTNWMATVANTFQITAIQIEAGSVATAFQTATGTIQGELAACQRYYAKSYASAVAVPTNSSTAGLNFASAGATAASTAYLTNVRLPVSMRAAPTTTIYSFTSSQTSRVSDGSGTDLAAGSGTSNLISDQIFTVQNSSGASITSAQGGFVFHYAASAEL